MHDTCHGVAGTGKHKVTNRGASKGEIANGYHRDSNGIAKFDLTRSRVDIAAHSGPFCFIKAHEDAA